MYFCILFLKVMLLLSSQVVAFENVMPLKDKLEIDKDEYRQEDFPVTDTYEEELFEDKQNLPLDFLDSLENMEEDVKPLLGAYQDIAKLRILNKITATNDILEVKIGQSIDFKDFKITPVLCWKSAVNNEVKVLLDISSISENKKIFHSWMLAHKPSVVTFEHPVYDINIIECTIFADKNNEEKK